MLERNYGRAVRGMLLALLTAGLITACGDGPHAPDASGRYELASVNGNAVPYLWYEGENTAEWLDAGTLTLRADGAFLYQADWRTTYAGGAPDSHVTYTLQGEYVVRSGGIRFHADGEWWADGTLTGAELTVVGENFVENRFVRQ